MPKKISNYYVLLSVFKVMLKILWTLDRLSNSEIHVSSKQWTVIVTSMSPLFIKHMYVMELRRFSEMLVISFEVAALFVCRCTTQQTTIQSSSANDSLWVGTRSQETLIPEPKQFPANLEQNKYKLCYKWQLDDLHVICDGGNRSPLIIAHLTMTMMYT